jgi:hypothetical protein
VKARIEALLLAIGYQTGFATNRLTRNDITQRITD